MCLQRNMLCEVPVRMSYSMICFVTLPRAHRLGRTFSPPPTRERKESRAAVLRACNITALLRFMCT